MSWMDQIGNLLQQYSGAGAQAAPDQAEDHFDQFAQAAPHSAVADGLAAAFRSNDTPPFPQMISQLFGQSSGYQRAGLLGTLISAAGPTIVSQILARHGASGLAGLLGGGGQEVSPEVAQQIPPEAVQEIAQQAEQRDPSVVDMASNFYAQHPQLVKTLGAAALTVALAKIASAQQGR
ncbi:MAG TPA: hypothetical protein VM864_03880 [Pyrinomonadaceae bacterium]|jgi:hypothetical protein|nr:hypothetical protein [Pyrinomonadaceae bacterium]